MVDSSMNFFCLYVLFVERGICEQSPQLVENKQRTEVTTP